MTLSSWVHEKLCGPASAKILEALEATDEVASKARELRQTIEPYAKMKDPFIALWTTRYEADQESRIHEGSNSAR